MAKQPPSRGGTSRLRFIMLDAEIPEGDLSQITAAIQNALKPATTVIQQRLPSPHVQPKVIANGSDGGGEIIDEQLIDAEDEEQAAAETLQAREPRAPRKPTVPKVLELDLTSGVPLESYTRDHPPKSEPDRALVVAAYFKEVRGEDAITVNHVYTCYRILKWPTTSDDFAWPLRYLKKQQLMTSPGRGQYAINGLGLSQVQKLGTTEA